MLDPDNPVLRIEKWHNGHITPTDWERDNTGKANVGQPSKYKSIEPTKWVALVCYKDGSVDMEVFDSVEERAVWLEPYQQSKDEYYRENWNQ